MKGKSKSNKRIDASRLITVFSVAMVLLVLGMTIVIGLGARKASQKIRSNIGFVAVVNPAYGQASVDSVRQILENAPFTDRLTVRDADEVLARWEEMMGPEELLDVNPFLPEFEVAVKEPWSRPDSLDRICEGLKSISCIDHVQHHSDIAGSINHSISSVMLLLILTGFALMVISVVLIANTVKLQVHSQRFIIHTQQYVGATASYIIRPYIRRAAVSGLVAALCASAALAGIVYYAMAIDPMAAALVTWAGVAVTSGVLIILGTGICAITARIAALKYIRRSYEDIFN